MVRRAIRPILRSCTLNLRQWHMKYVIRLFIILLFIAGFIGLIYYSTENKRLAADVNQLEAELGRMSIKDFDRVHIVEVAVPDVPLEVAPHIKAVWQFRCYLPPSYDFMNMSGGGRVTGEGLYLSGGFSSTWGTPQPTSVHGLMTVSLQERGNRLQAFYSFRGSSGTTSWTGFNADRLSAIVVRKLVNSKQGARSFDRDTILPLLKLYDPSTAEDNEVAGKALVSYKGGQIILCPKSRERYLEQLSMGETPPDFEPEWVATAVVDE